MGQQKDRERQFDPDDIADFEARLAKRTKELEWNQTAASELKEIGLDETTELRLEKARKLLESQQVQSQKDILSKFPGIEIPLDKVAKDVVGTSYLDTKSNETDEQDKQSELLDALDVDGLVAEVSAEDAELARLAAESQKEVVSDPELANKILLESIEAVGIDRLKARVPRDPAKNPAWHLLNLKTVKLSAKDLGLEQSIIDIHNRAMYRASKCTAEQNLEVYNNLMISINTQRHMARAFFTTALDQISGKTDAEKREFLKNADFTVDTKEKKDRLKAKRASQAQGGEAPKTASKPKLAFGVNAQKQFLSLIRASKDHTKAFVRLRTSMKEEGTWTHEHDAWGVKMNLVKQGE